MHMLCIILTKRCIKLKHLTKSKYVWWHIYMSKKKVKRQKVKSSIKMALVIIGAIKLNVPCIKLKVPHGQIFANLIWYNFQCIKLN